MVKKNTIYIIVAIVVVMMIMNNSDFGAQAIIVSPDTICDIPGRFTVLSPVFQNSAEPGTDVVNFGHVFVPELTGECSILVQSDIYADGVYVNAAVTNEVLSCSDTPEMLTINNYFSSANFTMKNTDVEVRQDAYAYIMIGEATTFNSGCPTAPDGYQYIGSYTATVTVDSTNQDCTDTDGGDNIYEAGSVMYDSQTYDDYCIDSDSVREYWCTPSAYGFGGRNCPSGSECVSGACTEPVEQNTCTDTDAGVDLDTKGTVTFNSVPYEDYCEDADTIVEYSCTYLQDITRMNTGTFTCANGCIDGTCSNECTDVCTFGERVCDSGGYRVCYSKPSNGCTDWSNIISCGVGETCTAGECIGEPTTCNIKGDSDPCNTISDSEVNIIIGYWKTNQGVSDSEVNNAISLWKTGA